MSDLREILKIEYRRKNEKRFKEDAFLLERVTNIVNGALDSMGVDEFIDIIMKGLDKAVIEALETAQKE